MRRFAVLPALAFAGGVTLCAQSPSGSAQQTFAVSVEVVRSCAIDSRAGSASVNCGERFGSQPTLDSNAPKPLVTDSGQSADSTVTVQF